MQLGEAALERAAKLPRLRSGAEEKDLPSLHVGKGIDPYDHVAAGLQALEGLITDRTKFLIEHHMIAHDYRAGTLSPRQVQKLKASPDFDELLLLSQCDEAGRVPGARVGTLDEALEYLKELERENG